MSVVSPGDGSLPVSSRQALVLGGLRIERVLIHAGAFPAKASRKLRIVATLGSGWEMQVDHGRRLRYDHGEICLLPPWLRRQSFFRASGDNLLISVDDALLTRLADEIGVDDPLASLPFQKLTDATVYQMVASIADELGPGGNRGPAYTEALATALIGHLLRGHLQASNVIVTGTGLTPQRLRRCQQYIETHLGDGLSIEVLAANAEMSRFHFTRAFKKAMGQTPHRYVLERRISVARMMVQTTSRPVNEIAAELGFANQSHFSAVFNQLTGVTPSMYRRRGGTGVART
jgi:AraC family transcriptional regulator